MFVEYLKTLLFYTLTCAWGGVLMGFGIHSFKKKRYGFFGFYLTYFIVFVVNMIVTYLER